MKSPEDAQLQGPRQVESNGAWRGVACNAREPLSGFGSAMVTTPGAASARHGLTRGEAVPLQIADEDDLVPAADLCYGFV